MITRPIKELSNVLKLRNEVTGLPNRYYVDHAVFEQGKILYNSITGPVLALEKMCQILVTSDQYTF